MLWIAAGCSPDSSPGIDPVDPAIENLIVISMDTLRADYLPIYGHPRVEAPTISRVAEEGLVFERHINCAPSTLTSHTSLFTGRYPHSHGTPRNGYVVPDENQLLAEILRGRDFQTAAFLGSFALASAFNFDQGFDVFDEKFELGRPSSAVVSAERTADRVTDAALAWLDRAEPGPLFLFVHYFDVHDPYLPPPPYAGMYFEEGWNFPLIELNLHRLRQRVLASGRNDFPEIRAAQAQYAAEITFTDSQLGRLLDELERRGILERSLLVITSDHGEAFADHAELFNHGQEVYEETVHTPLIVRFPEGRHGGRRVEALVSNVDVLPTLLDWLGVPVPGDVDGQSFAGILDGELPDRMPVFCEATQPWDAGFEKDPVWTNARKSRCVRTDRWKLVHRPLGGRFRPKRSEWELYDLLADPRERRNLVAEDAAANAEVVEKLKELLARWGEQAAPLDSAVLESEEARKALEALGYTK